MIDYRSNITELYYKVYYLKEDISIFEHWIYDTTELEEFLGVTKYLDVISIDYRAREAKHRLALIIEQYVNFEELEKRNLLSLLKSSMKCGLEQGVYLGELYERYCIGHHFLFDIAIGYGLPCLNASNYPKSLWDELDDSEKLELLSRFSGKIEPLLTRCISWIQDGSIIILGTRDGLNHWNYVDNRSMADKVSKIAPRVIR